MKKILRGLGIALLVVAGLIAVSAFAARFQDGPMAMFPGGPLVAGDWAEPTWQDASFLAEVGEIEFQLLSPARSRTTWVLVHEGKAYIPCGLPKFRLFKQWPHEAMVDGRAVVRTGGKRHRRTATRVTDPALLSVLNALVSEKYGAPATDPNDRDAIWYFRLDPRS